MAYNNRLLELPLEIFFKITKLLTIFDLVNLEKSGLFELNEQGISNVIQAAFERPRHINIHIDSIDEQENPKAITELILRCGSGLRSLIVKMRNRASFLARAHYYDKEFGTRLATSCPNIERFVKYDYHRDDYGAHPFRDYIRNIEISKLAEIYVTEPNLTLADLQILFTPRLKSVTVHLLGDLIESMEELSVSRPNFGTSIEQLTIFPSHYQFSDFSFIDPFEGITFKAVNFPKLFDFFPNLKTIKAKGREVNTSYNREQIYRSDFVYQLDLFSKYFPVELPYINEGRGEKFDLSSIIKYRPVPRPFDVNVIDRLTNLQSLELNRNDMMLAFSHYLSDATFKSLKILNFTDIDLTAETLPKFEKILLTGRFIVRSISNSYAFGVHSTLIPLLHQFCPKVKCVYIRLEPVDTEIVRLSAVQMKLLKDVGIAKKLPSVDDVFTLLLHKG